MNHPSCQEFTHLTVNKELRPKSKLIWGSLGLNNFPGRIYFFLLLFFIPFLANANYCYTTTDGDFLDSGIWSCGHIPACGDTIEISAGDVVDVGSHVVYDDTCFTAMFIIVNGTLDFGNGKKMFLPAGSGITINTGGEILAGNGSGSSNVIEIGGEEVWSARDDDVNGPFTFGVPYIFEIISISSGDWNDTGSWDCACVPDSNNRTVILTAHSIEVNVDSKVGDIDLNGTLTFATDVTLNVFGDLSNNGTYVNSSETITFSGADYPHDINGNATQTFNQIVCEDNGTVTTSITTVNIVSYLDVQSGSFSTNNGLVLLSDINGTASILDLSNGTITGDVTANRYVGAGDAGWRFLTSPIAGQTIGDWNDNFITSGFVGSDFPSFSFVSIYGYDESVAGLKENGFTTVATGTGLTVGTGFWTWAGQSLTGGGAFNIDLVGTINSGNVSLPVSFSNGTNSDDGWSLVGNPYPCPIDWNATDWTKTNIDDAIYVWNTQNVGYASYISGVGNNGGTNNVASHQGFYVKANATSPVLTARESVKSSNLADPFLKTTYANNVFRLKIINSDSTLSDETTFNFRENTSLAFDGMEDAYKLFNGSDGVNIMSSSSDASRLSINTNPLNQDLEIPISILLPENGVYTIKVQDLGGLSVFPCVYLKDQITGIEYNLHTTTSIELNITSSGIISNRFILSITTNPIYNVKDEYCSGELNGRISASGGGGMKKFIWKNAVGDTITTSIGVSDSLVNLGPGHYFVDVYNIGTPCFWMQPFVVGSSDPVADFMIGGTSFNPDSNLMFIDLSLGADQYYWNFGNGDFSSLANPIYSYSSSGIYEVTLIITTGGCSDTITSEIQIENLITDVSELEDSRFEIYPVPAENTFRIDVVTHPQSQPLSVKLYSLNGQVLKSWDYSSQVIYDISSIASGTYILVVLTEDAPFVQKLIKQ